MPCTVGAVRGKMRSTTLRHMPEMQTPAHLVAKSFSGSWVVISTSFPFLIFFNGMSVSHLGSSLMIPLEKEVLELADP